MDEIKLEGLGDIKMIVVHGDQQDVFNKSFPNVARVIIREIRK